MSGNLIENAVFTLLDLSHYSSNLPDVAKQRYLEKLSEIGCDCPYSIEHQLWVTSGIRLRKVLPDVTHYDLVYYLIFLKSAFTQEEMRNYKSCTAWKTLACDGKFFGMAALLLANSKVLVTARVHHSMAVNLPPLKPWIALNPDGTVLTAHCDCVAGYEL